MITITGNKIKKLRVEKVKLTQNELADKAGLHRHTIREIENGIQTNPSIQTLKNIAKALGCDLIEII